MIPPGTAWLTDPAAAAVCEVVEAGGHRIYFVGGCVRDALLGKSDSDVDLSTDAHPERVTELAEAAGMKVVPTGIAHGTVTVISGDQPFEVTTFRRDVENDGRRAVVAYSDRIEDDARRRDFTMNALYADRQGQVLDPLGGLPDLRARRVVFIDDAAERIREDYLRILRFFRFHAYYADPDAGLDADVLAAIVDALDGLAGLSGERIGWETRKLLAAPDPAQVLATMRATGVLGIILPGSDDRWMGPLVAVESRLGLAPDWRRRLACLGGQDVPERLKLSRNEAERLRKLREATLGDMPLPEVAYRHGAGIAADAQALRAALMEAMPEASMSETLSRAAEAVLPVRAADLMPAYSGPALGRRLAELEQRWIDSGFTLDRDALLALP
jgi:tRNA nucleotidyltransferase/poly(A) polymerase